MNYVVLGPVPCQGCRRIVFWGRRLLRGGSLTGDCRWRDVTDDMPHVCITEEGS